MGRPSPKLALFILPLAALPLLVASGSSPPAGPASPEHPKTVQGKGFPEVGPSVFTDDGSPPGATAKWGSIECAVEDRVSSRESGGDPWRRADGHRQGGSGFRKLQVLDGDDFYGERCELGENDHQSSPVALYRDGMRRITYLSLKLSKHFPLDRSAWQVVMQMKEAQPHDAGGSSPRLNLQAFDGEWRLVYVGRQLWSTPAARGRWVRFAFDVTYSTDPEVGSVRMFVDRNGDGDALDGGERSERYSVATLKTEGPGTSSDGLSDGDPIPSHLRVGIYHDPVYRCEGSRCSLGVDNVGVYNPAP